MQYNLFVTVVGGVVAVSLVGVIVANLVMNVVLMDRTKILHQFPQRFAEIESFLSQLPHMLSTDTDDNNMPLVMTADGKYSANSVSDLMQKMNNDPEAIKIATEEELREFFESMNEKNDEDDLEDWQKKGKK